jgi:hypothetical protein
MTLGDLFDRINSHAGGFGQGEVGLLKDVLAFNAEQREARIETFRNKCVEVMKAKPQKYPIEAIESFPEYPDDIENADSWFMGGYEVWGKAWKFHYNVLMEEEVPERGAHA